MTTIGGGTLEACNERRELFEPFQLGTADQRHLRNGAPLGGEPHVPERLLQDLQDCQDRFHTQLVGNVFYLFRLISGGSRNKRLTATTCLGHHAVPENPQQLLKEISYVHSFVNRGIEILK